MLSSIHSALGDQPQDMVRSATDLVLETLKSVDLKDFDKKKEVDALLGGISSETFAGLISLAKKITDYGNEEEGDKKNGDGDEEMNEADKIDDDVGVAVVFEDEEEDEEDDEGFEVRDESEGSEDEEGDGIAIEGEEEEEEIKAGSDDEGIMIGSTSAKISSKSTSSTSISIPAREIDGFYLQRLISASFPDPVDASSKSSAAMALLASESNTRDVENSLMELFDYEHFELVSKLLSEGNRDKIVWCTKLARSEESEKIDLEVAMREKGLGWVLKELNTNAMASNRMDIDSLKKPSNKVSLAPGTTAPPPRKLVDLESMAFSAGSRLMSNKKCSLPAGSFKRQKTGYEEVHVPAPIKSPLNPGEKLVEITDLPAWARQAFGKDVKTLNRIQSRLYPIAYGTDEPILLCAPTGGGKVSSDSLARTTVFN
jgi:pre-mRNA-splicing helicase BRR2